MTLAQNEAIASGAVYYGLPTEEYGEYIIGHEKLRDVIMANRELLLNMANIPAAAFNSTHEMQWDQLLAYEKSGSLYMFTIRIHGELVGVIGYMVMPDAANSGTISASIYGFFIKEEHRKGGLALKLMDYTERTLKVIGVSVIKGGDYEPIGGSDLSILFKRRKFKFVSRLYLKEL